MNRNAVYFTQRIASAAASALVHVAADIITQKTHKKKYQPNRRKVKPSYSQYKSGAGHIDRSSQSRPARQPYRSMSEQAKQNRQKGS